MNSMMKIYLLKVGRGTNITETVKNKFYAFKMIF